MLKNKEHNRASFLACSSMPSLVLLLSQILFHILCFLHDESHLCIRLTTGLCAPNIINVTRARRRMRLSSSAGSTTIHLVCLLWLSWAAHQVRSWAWGPYNDDWRKHVAPQDASHMYRVVLPRGNGTTAAAMFYGTGNSSSSTLGVNGSSTATNTTTTTTTTNSTTKIDTSCGVSSPLYTLQLSGADGFTFDEWWLKLSGNMLLFTSQKEKATQFGVNSDTKHLCIPRSSSTTAQSRTLIAIVETRLDQGPLYFLEATRSPNYQPEYEPIVCDSLEEGGLLSCSGESDQSANLWSGCGLQLELGSSELGATQDGNLNCSRISLHAFGT